MSKNKTASTRDLYYQSPARNRKVNLSTLIITSCVTLAIGVIIGLNYESMAPYFTGKKAIGSVDFSQLDELYQELATDFDGDIDKTKVIQEAKRGLVKAAGDPYTYYMTADEATEFEKDLNGDVGAGIGVEIGERGGYIKVLRTTPDNPARKAGVLAGDIIYKADGEDISALSVEDVAKRLRGAAGSEVTLTVVRNGEEIDFKLVRETINNVSAYIDYQQEKAIITITRFDNDTGSLVTQLAKEALEKNYDKFVIDLRGNGGGYVSAARDVASLWIDGDLIVDQRSSNGVYSDRTMAHSGRAILKGKSTVVLINGNSASAAEIVAGALQDYKLATLIGEQSYGKGSVQSLEKLSGGEMLRVTVAKWYTPNNQNINGSGITPDEIVERSFDQINNNEDPQLDAALKK